MLDFDDILNSIKEIAQQHEEPYRDGAWEAFLKARRKKKRAILIWPFVVSGLAASLIIGYFALGRIFKTDIRQDSSPAVVNSTKVPSDTLKDTGTIALKTAGTKKKNVSLQVKFDTLSYQKSIISETGQKKRIALPTGSGVETNNLINEQDKPFTGKEDTITIASIDTMKESETHNEYANDLIDGLNEIPPQKNKSSRISMGFLISPLLASNKDGSHPGFSTGVQADIAISHKVSINSGLTFAHQKVENSFNGNSSVSEPVSLSSKLISFDIPVNLKIYLRKGKTRESYLVAGISSIGYINELNTFTYVFEEVIKISKYSEGQEIITYRTIYTEENVQNKEPAFSTFHFAGFMNLSYGLKSPFSKNMYLTIEPYIKLPLSGLTTNNLRYTTGGISLIILK